MFNRTRFSRTLTSKRTMYFALVFVLISITTMTLAYAALSTTLNITGTAEFKEASWGLKIEERSIPEYFIEGYTPNGNAALYGDATLLSKPTISGTSINNFRVQFIKPGDWVDMVYNVTNIGNLPAILTSFAYAEPEFSSATNNQDDILLAENYFQYYAC